jgi:hypothetical protein
VFDCGPLGEGNHGHFDALSFELAAHGRSLIVDPGRYTYSEAGDINWRVHFRGTAAHNTVCVDGRHQTCYLPKPIKDAGSRHAAGSVRHKVSGPAPQTALLECAHALDSGRAGAAGVLDLPRRAGRPAATAGTPSRSGVERLFEPQGWAGRAGPVPGASFTLLHGRAASHEYDAVHDRVIVFVDGCYWIVSDWLRGQSEHEYMLNFQLAPEAADRTTICRSRERGGTPGVVVTSPGLLLVQPRRDGIEVALHDGWVSARYGFKDCAPALRCRARGVDADFDTVLVPWRDAPALASVDDVAVRGERGALAAAQRMVLELGNVVRHDLWFHARSAEPQGWHIGDLRFEGRWLHLRRRPDGSLARARSHPGATLRCGPSELPLEAVGAGAPMSATTLPPDEAAPRPQSPRVLDGKAMAR